MSVNLYLSRLRPVREHVPHDVVVDADERLHDGIGRRRVAALRERRNDHAWEAERAELVRTLRSEEQAAAQAAEAEAQRRAAHREAEEAARRQAEAEASEAIASALRRQARAAAHAEALRNLSACLPAASRANPTASSCLACLG